MTSPSTATEGDFPAALAHLESCAPALLQRALPHGEAYADLFIEASVLSQRQASRQLGLRPSYRLASPQQTHVTGSALQVLTPAGRRFASTSSLLPGEALVAAIDAHAHVPVRPPAVRPLDDAALTAPPAFSTRDVLEQALDALSAGHSDVRLAEAQVQYQFRQAGLANTAGALVSWSHSTGRLRVEVVLGETRARGYAVISLGNATGDEAAISAAATQALSHALALQQAKPLQAGTYPVVLSQGCAGVWLHEAVGHLLEADSWPSGPFARARHKLVAPPVVNVQDDPTLPGGPASQPFDDEGSPTSPTVLLERGILKAILSDRLHALRDRLPYTGNGRRQDYRFPPLPRMTHLQLQPGEHPPEALIASVQKGLFITQVGHGMVRPGDGVFRLEVIRGRQIEKGRLTSHLRPFWLTGSPGTLLQKIMGVGNDLSDPVPGLCKKGGQAIPVSMATPTLHLGALRAEPMA